MKHSNEQKEFLLSCILRDEAKEAEYGAKASKLRKRYVLKYSEFQAKDKLELIDTDGKIKYGIIELIRFDTSPFGFTYTIRPTDKTFSKETKRKAFYHYYTNEFRGFNEIKSIKKISQL